MFHENDIQKRTYSFFLCCVPLRLALTYILFLYLNDIAWLFATFFILNSLNFFRKWMIQTPQSRGGFKGLVWWRRDVHAFLFLVVFVFIVVGEVLDVDVVNVVVAILVGDVVFGVLHWFAKKPHQAPEFTERPALPLRF